MEAERWHDFAIGPGRYAASIAIRDLGLAVRPFGTYFDALTALDLTVSYEGAFRQATFDAAIPTLPDVLDALPDPVTEWAKAQRPQWFKWLDAELTRHRKRRGFLSALAESSGAATPIEQPSMFAQQLLERAPPDHPSRDLHQFQRVGVDWLDLACGRAVLGDEMGLGKTIQILTYLDLCDASRVLIVSPASVTDNWIRESERWTQTWDLEIGRKAADIQRILDPDGEFGLVGGRWGLIISWGMLHRVLPKLLALNFDAVVFDEAHNIKTHAAKRTRAALALGWKAERRIAATGTEIRSRPRELWTLLHLVDPLRFTRFKRFAERYCGAKWKSIGWGRRARNYDGANRLPELNRLVRPYIARRERRDVLPQLPPKRRAFLSVDSPVVRRREYRQAMARLRGKRNDGAEQLAVLGKLRRWTGEGKVKAALEWLDNALEADEQVVVFLYHRDIHAQIDAGLSKLGVPHAAIVGSTPQAKRQSIVDAFQAGDIKVLIGSEACKEGVTLTAACHTLHVERWWVPGDEDQAEDRVCRIGQTRGVLNTYLHLCGSLDDHVHAILTAKRKIIAQIQDRSPITNEVLAAIRATS